MGHHHDENEHLSHEELKFREHVERAGHFIKIELFRSAREEYKAALNYHPGNDMCLSQIRLMNSNIARDRKSVLIIAPIVIAIIAAIALLA
ncbi:MAG: hypothetical protein PHP04_06025 [Bacteroidales bacterium]|nr:hypothetical protein [Bacteroidales bacterium]NCA75071.1 hypothetical protein [Alphaproteobacteria bacterium]HNW73497.1 hypothetical protein [Bacteroidales bacterium]